jgi:hypothetical protein
MQISTALDELENSARTARNAAGLVGFALCVVGTIILFSNDGTLPAIGLYLAAGTCSHTASTIGALVRTLRQLADDAQLDREIITGQQEVIAILREGRHESR